MVRDELKLSIIPTDPITPDQLEWWLNNYGILTFIALGVIYITLFYQFDAYQ